MEISYRHNINNNYVVIKNSNIYINDYRLNMVLKNDIKGLLGMYASCVDGEVELSYTISSKQSIKDLYERKKMTYEEILNIISSIIDVCREVQRYLLRLEDVIFDAELAYFDYGSKEVAFCYYPNRECNSKAEIRNFVQELMRITDHEDMRAVELIYGVFNVCNQDNFLISDIEKYVNVGGGTNLKTNLNDNIDINDNTYISEMAYDNGAISREEPLFDKVCENDNEGYSAFDAPESAVCEQDIKNILKNNVLLKKVADVFSKERVQNKNVTEKIDRRKVKKSYEDNYNKSLMNKSYEGTHRVTSTAAGYEDSLNRGLDESVRDDTMFIKDIISNTTRRLLSLTEKDNIDITEYPFIIGKLSSRVDYVIDEKSVSRIHLKISRDEEGNYYMEDMNSKNGTYLNGILAEPHEKIRIEIGDKIRIATFEYIFR